jgi:hypothetical protein
LITNHVLTDSGEGETLLVSTSNLLFVISAVHVFCNFQV